MSGGGKRMSGGGKRMTHSGRKKNESSLEDVDLQIARQEQLEEDGRLARSFDCKTSIQEDHEEDITAINERISINEQIEEDSRVAHELASLHGGKTFEHPNHNKPREEENYDEEDEEDEVLLYAIENEEENSDEEENDEEEIENEEENEGNRLSTMRIFFNDAMNNYLQWIQTDMSNEFNIGESEANQLMNSLFFTFRPSRAINFIHIPKNAGTSLENIYRDSNGVMVYHGHGANVRNIPNQLIVIRNPVERFISAVKYAKREYEVKIFENNCDDTPENWIRAWRDPNHVKHEEIMKHLKNTSGEHKIGDNILEYKWTYTPQSEWIHHEKVKYVVLFENLEFEIKCILREFGEDCNLARANNSGDVQYELSAASIEFLRTIYADDFRYYQEVKNKRMNPIREVLHYDHRT